MSREAQSPVVCSETMSVFWRQFLALFGLGMLGILALIPVSLPLLQGIITTAPEATPPLPMLFLLSVIQSALLVAVAVWVGLLLAPRLGLRSHVSAWAREGTPVTRPLKAEAPLALLLGAGVGILIILLDTLFQPFLGEAWVAYIQEQPRTMLYTLAGLLYGGITEELLTRWGLLTLVAWLGWKLLQRSRGLPKPSIMWSAIVLAAVLFGVLHLPALAVAVSLTPLLVVRTVLLNALGALAVGWLYWRRSLEAAMMAHAMAHVAMSFMGLGR